MNDFFRRAGVATLTTKELFDFAVDPSIPDARAPFHAPPPALDARLDALMAAAASRPVVRTAEEEVAERVWAQAHIPRKLEEVVHYERDHAALQAAAAARAAGGGGGAGGAAAGDVEGGYYQAFAGMRTDMRGAAAGGAAREGGASGSSSGSGSGSGSESGSESGSGSERAFEERPRVSREDAQRARKEHKREVKGENAERRKTKLKKHVKKRATRAKK